MNQSTSKMMTKGEKSNLLMKKCCHHTKKKLKESLSVNLGSMQLSPHQINKVRQNYYKILYRDVSLTLDLARVKSSRLRRYLTQLPGHVHENLYINQSDSRIMIPWI